MTRPVSDALPRLDRLAERSREITGRSAGWASGANSRELREVKAEITAIKDALNPVHLAYRDLLLTMSELADGRPHDTPGQPVCGYAAFAAYDELCGDGNPDVRWLKARENARAQVAEMAGMVAKAAMRLATEAAAGLAEVERWRASVRLEAAE